MATVSVRAVCERCGGTGWIKTADQGAGAARRCDCYKQALGARLLEQSGIPERYQRCSLESFKVTSADQRVAQVLLQARRTAELYVDDLLDPDNGQLRDLGLIFIGQPGSGKTHLAAAVLAAAIRRYHVRGRFESSTRLFGRLQETFEQDSAESRHRILRPVMEAELLVLDELGFRRASDWMKDTLHRIIDHRYNHRLPTLFTTNYPLTGSTAERDRFNPDVDRREPLAARISTPLVSRICEMAQPVIVDGWDYRREVKMHRHRIGR